ncbi:MAG: phage major capsid protein [Candidatus Omnitrophica bacterium]|nr:phage major capsid protein [Candidatus Omnitrophota bacterium]
MEKRLAEIKERKAAILEELNGADQEKLTALNAEADALNTEEKELRSKMDLKGKIKPVADEATEDRAAKFARDGRMAIPVSETRSTLLSGGKIATPTGVGGIGEPQNILSSIIDMITVEDLTGMGSYKEAFVSAWQTAGAGTEGTVANTSDPTFKIAVINPFDIDVVSYVSKQIKKQSPLLYEEKVRKGALIALKKKAVSYIIGGDGATEPFGIYNAADSAAAALCEELDVTSSTIDEGTLRKIVFAYGGDENVGAGAKLFLHKNDLIAFGDVRGTSEKKAVYEIIPDGSNPNIGIIKDGGLSVPYVLCSDVTALSDSTYNDADIPTMIYGNPANYKLGLFGDFEVAVSDDYKFGEGLLTVRGEVVLGGNVVADKGFLIVNLTTA